MRKYLLFLAAIFTMAALNLSAQPPTTGSRPASASAPLAKSPTVKQIDADGLRKALTPAGKPLLVNFWATWCEPCREEFPDLVKLDAEYKGKIDFITVSVDDLAEINRDVPKFLSEMKATMPAYLLKTPDEDAAIRLIWKDFSGALPFTVLYEPGGKQTYLRQGKVVLETVRAELDKLLVPVPSAPVDKLK